MKIKEKKPTQQMTTVERFNVGDRVVFNNLNSKPFIDNGYTMIVDEIRIMFAKNVDTGDWLKAYTVKFPNGDRGEYDETQLINVSEC